MAFSPDGRTLASGYLGGTVHLWDVADPAHPRPLGQPLTSGSSVSANVVAFSPDGRTLASGNNDGTIRLWDVTDPAHPRPLGQPLSDGSSVSVSAVAFSSDGHTLASGDGDGITWLWNLNVHNAIERICITAGDLTLSQWHEYIPRSKYLPAYVALP